MTHISYKVKVKSKWIMDLNINPKPMELLSKHTEENPHACGLGED
jgi:hypothetical protein